MSISGIISVSGKPGLYKVVTQTKNGLIAESLIDNKRIPVYATQKVSALEEISIYTYEDDIPLAEVFAMILKKTDGKQAIDHKSKPDELKNYFEGILENYDKDRVYNSDLKKLFQWFNLLVDKGLLKEEEKEEKKETPKKSDTESKEKKPTKKAATTKKSQATGKKNTTVKKTQPKKATTKSTTGQKKK